MSSDDLITGCVTARRAAVLWLLFILCFLKVFTPNDTLTTKQREMTKRKKSIGDHGRGEGGGKVGTWEEVFGLGHMWTLGLVFGLAGWCDQPGEAWESEMLYDRCQ